jgi:hypothetical protein
MPDIVGRLRPPRLNAAPAAPVIGEIYFNTVDVTLYTWSGWNWRPVPVDPKPVIKRPGVGGTEQGPITGIFEPFGLSAGDLRHTITPAMNLWWETAIQMLVRVSDAVWYECDLFMQLIDAGSALNPDALGQSKAPYSRVTAHSGGGQWRTIQNIWSWKLDAGKTYIAQPVLSPVAGSWFWYSNAQWTGSRSKVEGYW